MVEISFKAVISGASLYCQTR